MLKKIFLFICFFIAAISFAVFITFWLGKRELAKQQDAYLAEGGILDPALFAPPAVPDDENAARAYEPIFTFLTNLTNDEKDLLGDEERLAEPAMQALLLKSAATVDALYAATALPDCRWDISYDGGIDVLLPHLGQIRSAAKLLELHAYAAAADSNDQSAKVIIQDIEAILNLGLHSAEDPTLIGQLVAASVLGLGIGLYEELFIDHAAPPNNITTILAAVDQQARFRRALRTEILFTHVTLTRGGGPDSLNLQLPRFAGAALRWDRAFYFSSMRDAIQNTHQPFYQARTFPEPPWYAITTQMLMPALENAGLALARAQLLIQMLETAEQLRAHKTEHGSYPAPGIIEMPVDPTTGKPIQYEIKGEGFILTGLIGHPNSNEVSWTWEN